MTLEAFTHFNFLKLDIFIQKLLHEHQKWRLHSAEANKVLVILGT